VDRQPQGNWFNNRGRAANKFRAFNCSMWGNAYQGGALMGENFAAEAGSAELFDNFMVGDSTHAAYMISLHANLPDADASAYGHDNVFAFIGAKQTTVPAAGYYDNATTPVATTYDSRTGTGDLVDNALNWANPNGNLDGWALSVSGLGLTTSGTAWGDQEAAWGELIKVGRSTFNPNATAPNFIAYMKTAAKPVGGAADKMLAMYSGGTVDSLTHSGGLHYKGAVPPDNPTVRGRWRGRGSRLARASRVLSATIAALAPLALPAISHHPLQRAA
jgi:hypothetical protein